ncbi:hypothetical protein NEIG_00422 [Nematocida sp. ERTm5]|nr:hypothetical protein NEIG_00422 [Nematocida sp. ERTm5]
MKFINSIFILMAISFSCIITTGDKQENSFELDNLYKTLEILQNVQSKVNNRMSKLLELCKKRNGPNKSEETRYNKFTDYSKEITKKIEEISMEMKDYEYKHIHQKSSSTLNDSDEYSVDENNNSSSYYTADEYSNSQENNFINKNNNSEDSVKAEDSEKAEDSDDSVKLINSMKSLEKSVFKLRGMYISYMSKYFYNTNESMGIFYMGSFGCDLAESILFFFTQYIDIKELSSSKSIIYKALHSFLNNSVSITTVKQFLFNLLHNMDKGMSFIEGMNASYPILVCDLLFKPKTMNNSKLQQIISDYRTISSGLSIERDNVSMIDLVNALSISVYLDKTNSSDFLSRLLSNGIINTVEYMVCTVTDDIIKKKNIKELSILNESILHKKPIKEIPNSNLSVELIDSVYLSICELISSSFITDIYTGKEVSLLLYIHPVYYILKGVNFTIKKTTVGSISTGSYGIEVNIQPKKNMAGVSPDMNIQTLSCLVNANSIIITADKSISRKMEISIKTDLSCAVIVQDSKVYRSTAV